jgi:hypothetical protein
MKDKTPIERQEQALHALNCAIACLVAWPQTPEQVGGAVYFTALALHRLAQADTSGEAGVAAEKLLAAARETKNGIVIVAGENRP